MLLLSRFTVSRFAGTGCRRYLRRVKPETLVKLSCFLVLGLAILTADGQSPASQRSAITTRNGLLKILVSGSDWTIETRSSPARADAELILLRRVGSLNGSPEIRIHSTPEPIALLDTAAVATANHSPADGWTLEGKLSPADPGQPFCLVFVRGRDTVNEEKNVVFSLGTGNGGTEVTIIMKMRELTRADRAALQTLLSGFTWQTVP